MRRKMLVLQPLHSICLVLVDRLLLFSDALNNWTETGVTLAWAGVSIPAERCLGSVYSSTHVVCGEGVTDPVWQAAVDPLGVDAALYVQRRVCCVLVSKCLADPQMANPTAKFEIKEMLLANERMKTPK